MFPEPIERKQVSGITFEQGRNEIKLNDPALFENIPTASKTFTDEAKRDLMIALITLKSRKATRMLRERRTGHRHRSRATKPYPLYASGGQQGRHLVVAPTSEGDEPAVRGENPPCRPRQYHRHLYQRRLYGRVG